MWDVLKRVPRGRVSARAFITIATILLVAVFANLTLFTASGLAVPLVSPGDAKWNGDKLSYNGRDYTGPTTATDNDSSTLPKGTVYYQSNGTTTTNAVGSGDGFLIYFSAGTDVTTATKASYVTAKYDVASGRYSNLSPPSTISVDKSTYGSAESIASSTCNVDGGLGWMICPLSRTIASGMDYIYGVVASFLKVEPISTNTSSSLYKMWDIVKNVANILFIIGFLVLIYAQISGAIMSNYTIKKILPRIIVAAILVNTSYWICAIGVDISNILGSSVDQMFQNLRGIAGAANSQATQPIDWSSITWTNVTAAALSGGLVIGVLNIVPSTGIAFALLGALIPALFAVFVAVTILAARQALITIFIIISPLAFVAYLLPNTEEWFGRWRKLFISMLIMFPAFSVVFGASQVAGVIIIQNAQSLPVVILGLLVQVVPLFITPFLIKLSTGVLGTIAGLANDKSKGIFDRAQNWAHENRDARYAKTKAKGLDKLDRSRWRNRNALTRYATSAAYRTTGKQRRDVLKTKYDNAIGTYADAQVSRTRKGYQAYELGLGATQAKDAAENLNHQRFSQRMSQLDEGRRQPRTALGRRHQAQEDRRYEHYRHLEHQSHEAKTVAEALDKGRHEKHQADFDQRIAQAPAGTYDARLRDYMEQTVIDSKRSGSAKAIIEKKGEARWDDLSRTDGAIQNLRLTEEKVSDTARKAAKDYENLIESIRAKGGETKNGRLVVPGLAVGNTAIASSLQASTKEIAALDMAISAAKVEQSESMAKALQDSYESTNPAERILLETAGGIGGERARNRVYAKAKSDVVNAAVEEVKTNRSIISGYSREMLKHMIYQGEDPQTGNLLTEEMKQAAMYELLIDKGNNMDANEIRDAVNAKGMAVDEKTGDYYEPQREADGSIKFDKETKQPVPDMSRPIEKSAAGARRDWQQFFVDAMKTSPHKLSTLSGTDQSKLNSGTSTDTSVGAFLRDIGGGKFGPERLANADVDELKIWLNDIRSGSGEFSQLPTEKRDRIAQRLINTVRTAQTDINIRGKIEDRNRGVMNEIVGALDPSYAESGSVDPTKVNTFKTNSIGAITNGDDAESTFTSPIPVPPDIYTPGQTISAPKPDA